MARIRSIKPEFWQDERLAEVSRDARLVYIGLWNLADDFGVLRGNPRYIRGQVLPYDDVDVSALLGELERLGRIVRYRDNDEDLLLVVNFTRHQRVDRRTRARPALPPGFEIVEMDGADANGKPGRVLHVVRSSPPSSAHNPAGSALSHPIADGIARAPHFPIVGAGKGAGSREQGQEGCGEGSARTASPLGVPPLRISWPTLAPRLAAVFREAKGADYAPLRTDETAIGRLYSLAIQAKSGDPDAEVVRRWRNACTARYRKATPSLTELAKPERWNEHAAPEEQGPKATTAGDRPRLT